MVPRRPASRAPRRGLRATGLGGSLALVLALAVPAGASAAVDDPRSAPSGALRPAGTAGVPGTGAPGDGPASAGASSAGSRTVGRWRVVQTPSGSRLLWTAPRDLPFGGARVEIRAGGVSLGAARPARDGRTVSVALPAGSTLEGLSDLEVLAAGRRLDVAPVALAAGGGAPATRDALAAAAAPALPAVTPDPGRVGPYRTVTAEYTLPGLTVAGLPVPVEVQGVLVTPLGAKGRRPLVLLLHGRHFTCYRGGPQGEASGDWPCTSGWRAIPSHRGYLQVQRLLASQGYDTVSISANGINAQDYLLPDGGAAARSVLVRHHLSLWATWATPAGRASAPAVVRSAPVADLSRVVLVGHSRGGEGVNRAALDTVALPDGAPRPAWRISGLLHLAPTAFGQNPAPGVPAAVVLPSCDGDVFDLQGQAYVDAVRDLGPDPVLRSSVLVVGANHNYFNTEWTPGVAQAPAQDDWFDPSDSVCGTKRGNLRLTSAQQRAVGATYVAAAARVFVGRDERALPLLDGSPVRAASAGKARVLTHALGGNRRLAVKAGTVQADPGPVVRGSGSVRAVLCRGYGGPAASACVQLVPEGVHPHFLPLGPPDLDPARRAVSVRWSRATGSAAVTPRTVPSLRGSTALAMRVIVPPGSRSTSFSVRVTDGRGRTADLGRVTLNGLPLRGGVGDHWAQEVRLPLSKARGLDLRRLARITVVPVSRAGNLLVLDAWGWSRGLSAAAPLRLPRLDVGTVTVVEGSADRTVQLTVRVSNRVATVLPQRVWVLVLVRRGSDYTPHASVVTLPRGQRSVTVPVPVHGNARDDLDTALTPVLLKPLSGLITGDYMGGVEVQDDDPTPALTAAPVDAAVTEGGTLRWRFTLSEPSNLDVFVPVRAVVPAGGVAELSTDDVPASWVEERLGDVPTPPLPFSEAGLVEYVLIQPGATSADLAVPTTTDTRAEGTETVTWEVVESEEQPQLPAGTRFAGTVADAGSAAAADSLITPGGTPAS